MLILDVCPGCGKEWPEASDRCNNCGLELCPECQSPLTPGADQCESCGLEFDLLCPRCEAEVANHDLVCPHCGMLFDEDESAGHEPYQELGFSDDHHLDGSEVAISECPQCSMPLFKGENFCRECGLTLCPSCGAECGDEDLQCRSCGEQLFFNCPNCNFLLTAGSEQCPDCYVLFPNFCSGCLEPVNPGAVHCSTCGQRQSLAERHSARTLRSIAIGDRQFEIVACPDCGRAHDPILGDCPKCGTRICVNCKLVLFEGETGCPRCGIQREDTVTKSKVCSNCGSAIRAGQSQCYNCGHSLCPECLALVAEDDLRCLHCGSEFELYCPECGESVASGDSSCSNCGVVFSLDAADFE